MVGVAGYNNCLKDRVKRPLNCLSLTVEIVQGDTYGQHTSTQCNTQGATPWSTRRHTSTSANTVQHHGAPSTHIDTHQHSATHKVQHHGARVDTHQHMCQHIQYTTNRKAVSVTAVLRCIRCYLDFMINVWPWTLTSQQPWSVASFLV